jgi:hypothetical protein
MQNIEFRSQKSGEGGREMHLEKRSRTDNPWGFIFHHLEYARFESESTRLGFQKPKAQSREVNAKTYRGIRTPVYEERAPYRT